MSTVNPDFLLGDELEFEIVSRGEEPASKVDEKRKQLRGLLRCGKGVLPASEWRLDVEKDIEWCKERATELRGCVEDLGEHPDTQSRVALRYRTRLESLERRLVGWGQHPESEGKWPILPTLISVRDCLCKLVPGAGASSRDGQGASDLMVSMNQDLIPPPRKPANLDEGAQHASTVSKAVVSHGPSVVPAAMPVVYEKLPNPLGSVLREIPATHGLDAGTLLQFLGALIRVREFPGMTDNSLLQIAYPYCRGPLAEKLVACLERGGSFDEFHKEVLEAFLPGRMKERLCQEKFYRLQDRGEPLAAFISSIKQVAKVLRVALSEQEIVGVILDALTPEERSRLVFATRPISFADLDNLCITSRAVAYADSFRQARRGVPASVNLAQVQEVTQEDRGSGLQGPVCYGCGQRGHIRRFCRGDKAKPKPAPDGEKRTKNMPGGRGATL